MREDEGEDSGRGVWGAAAQPGRRIISPPKDREISESEGTFEKLSSERESKSPKVTQ